MITCLNKFKKFFSLSSYGAFMADLTFFKWIVCHLKQLALVVLENYFF